MAQWPGTSQFGPTAQPLLGTGRDTPIMPLLLVPVQAAASQASLTILSPDPASFLAWMCMFMCHCPSLGCELLQGRGCLSHLLFPVLLVGLGTMQGLFGKYLAKSLPNQTGSPCTLARGPSPADQACLRCAAHSISTCHISSPCLPLLVFFQPILTFCLGKSQGNSVLLLELLPMRLRLNQAHGAVSLHRQRCCYFQLSGLLSLPAWVPP